MRRGERRERCFFMETILGSCWTTCLPFLASRLEGAARAGRGVEVEKRAVRDMVGVGVVVNGEGVNIDLRVGDDWKSRWKGARRLNVDAIIEIGIVQNGGRGDVVKADIFSL